MLFLFLFLSICVLSICLGCVIVLVSGVVCWMTVRSCCLLIRIQVMCLSVPTLNLDVTVSLGTVSQERRFPKYGSWRVYKILFVQEEASK